MDNLVLSEMGENAFPSKSSCARSAADHKTTALMERLLEEEKPDFVMITGDTVYGENNVHLLRPALQPILSADVPFTFLFGNHDTEDGEGYDAIGREQINWYNTYGHEGVERGCRIFLLKEDKSGVFETYLRLADGSLILSQTPHETGQQEEQG